MLGLALDLGRVYIAKNETQSFTDTAALAAALALNDANFTAPCAFEWKLIRDADSPGLLEPPMFLTSATLTVVAMGTACLLGLDHETGGGVALQKAPLEVEVLVHRQSRFDAVDGSWPLGEHEVAETHLQNRIGQLDAAPQPSGLNYSTLS